MTDTPLRPVAVDAVAMLWRRQYGTTKAVVVVVVVVAMLPPSLTT